RVGRGADRRHRPGYLVDGVGGPAVPAEREVTGTAAGPDRWARGAGRDVDRCHKAGVVVADVSGPAVRRDRHRHRVWPTGGVQIAEGPATQSWGLRRDCRDAGGQLTSSGVTGSSATGARPRSGTSLISQA